MPLKLKRKSKQALLPTELLSSLEKSDKQASTKRRKQFTSHTLPKSLATKSQYNIQTNLIECRILLQRAISCYSDGSESAGDSCKSKDEERDGSVATGLEKLLGQLINARSSLCGHMLQNESSDDDSDDNHDGSNDKFQKDYNKLKSQWKTILNRHYDNMNITKRYNKKDSSSKFFQVVDQSFWSQVENTVQHSMLLEQHSQIITKNDDDETNEGSKAAPSILFDDAKIYQYMLQEYISLSTERTANDATSLAEHRLKLASSKNRKKNKEDVDRRASKGRKIRYVVHEKLKNFTFPLQREVNSQIDDDVLFKSMMGGVLTKQKKSQKGM